MRLAISNIAWPAGADAEAAPVLLAHGVEGVELALTKVWPEPLAATGAEVRAYRDGWERGGLRVAALQALLFGKPHLTLFGAESVRRQTLEYLSGMIALAEGLGASVMVFGSPKNRQRGGMSPAEAWAVAVPFFRELGRAAARRGVCFCIEPNPPAYGCDFITTAAEGAALVDAVGEEGFGLHLDTAGLSLVGEGAEESLSAAGARCKHFHVSAPHLAEVDGTGICHAPFADGLRSRGYYGWVSIEMAEPKNSWPAAVARALDFVRTTYLRRAA